MAQKILPGAHLLEMFMPYRSHETKMIGVLEKAADLGFYKNMELGIFFDRENRRTVRNILEANGLNATTFSTPWVKDDHLSLADLDEGRRRKAVDLCKKLTDLAAETGYSNFGVPSGDDPGPVFRGLAKLALKDSMVEIAEHLKQYGMNLTIEPLDRYVFKKQLIGPMEETAVWFKEVKEAAPNAYIHWDSAHEALGGIDLMESLELAAPYMGQFHLCDTITDSREACFGDLHMDVARAPEWTTEGFLTPEVGAEILKKAASFDKPEGMPQVYVAVEVLGHPGDDLWLKEQNVRAFLTRCFELAGLELA
ncbi:MAG: sugar phosphate isomerase/epimerase [Lachnospiraceae bacterium]|nr:sugar phosphate isomerase/epimerase [Lachnospiraceae bacterium]